MNRTSTKTSRLPSSTPYKRPVFETDKPKSKWFSYHKSDHERRENKTNSRLTFDVPYIHRIWNTLGGVREQLTLHFFLVLCRYTLQFNLKPKYTFTIPYLTFAEPCLPIFTASTRTFYVNSKYNRFSFEFTHKCSTKRKSRHRLYIRSLFKKK